MPNLTASEYRDEINSLAETIRDEAAEYSREISEVMHETIDGHMWVIYTAYHYEVLSLSENDGAAADFGVNSLVVDGELNTALLAFCAIEADVYEAISELPDLEEDEDEEDE